MQFDRPVRFPVGRGKEIAETAEPRNKRVSYIHIALERSKPSSIVRNVAFAIFFGIALSIDLAVYDVLAGLVR
jgi:hypothetical protein